MVVLYQSIRSRIARRLAAFIEARQAIAAVEFAIIMPVLVIFMLGGAEGARYVNISQQLTNLAFAEANLVAERPATSATMTMNDVAFIQQATPIVFPSILMDAARKHLPGSQPWASDIQFTISSVLFSPTVAGCTSSCTYKGVVQWSIGENASPRSCGTAHPPTAALDSAAPSLTTLPSDVFNAGSLIVVDLVYTYTPIFGSTIFHATLRRSAYLQPRYVSQILYSGTLSC